MQKIDRFKTLLILLVVVVTGNQLKAQTTDALGTYTPYSLFGIGEIMREGTAVNIGMGGIGIGVRDNRFINYLNPASITERDTLSFMLDFGINQKNYYNTNGNKRSAYNTFNMQNVIFTAPIYKKSAIIVGVTPYSNVGYKFQSVEERPDLVSKYGEIKYQKYGEGSINQLFVGASVVLFKHLSVGAEYLYYFGSQDKYSNIIFTNSASNRNLENSWNYSLRSHSGKVGLQYFGKLSDKMNMTVGATYKFKSKFKGDLTKMVIASDGSKSVDTVRNTIISNPDLSIPSSYGVGVSISKKNKWMIGVDYLRQDWRKTDLPELSGVDFKPIASNNINLGFEYIPNKYDIRYYLKRVTYRFGAYYDASYLQINNNQVKGYGITFGASLPIYRWYNAVNFSVDLGQRGSIKNNLVKENYIKFIINISLHDIWFMKHKYQ